MSGYKRFVAYIYEYKQGEKRESAGFVKINARGEECKIWVHMKGFYVHGQMPYQIHVFFRKRERILGHLIGELENRNGALEWNGVTKTDSLMESGLSLEESRGIYIEGAGRVFAAEWDDYPVDVERFEPAKGFARQKTEPLASEPVEEETAAKMIPAPVEVHSDSEIMTREEESAAEEPGLCPEPVEPARLKEVLDPRKAQWEYLTRHFAVMQYVDQDAVISSIRLGSKDLARIPRDKWGLGNNSFLFHGFYQYHHLLLLRRETGQSIQYLIGVPGVYNEREQVMASMFGFQEFKVMKGPDKGNGSFGYWCRTLEQQ